MTTLGYGDLVPQTPFGQVVGSFCAMSGILVVSLPIPVFVENFQRLWHAQNLAKKHSRVVRTIRRRESHIRRTSSATDYVHKNVEIDEDHLASSSDSDEHQSNNSKGSAGTKAAAADSVDDRANVYFGDRIRSRPFHSSPQINFPDAAATPSSPLPPRFNLGNGDLIVTATDASELGGPSTSSPQAAEATPRKSSCKLAAVADLIIGAGKLSSSTRTERVSDREDSLSQSLSEWLPSPPVFENETKL